MYVLIVMNFVQSICMHKAELGVSAKIINLTKSS